MRTQGTHRVRAHWPLLLALAALGPAVASLGPPVVAADSLKLVPGAGLPMMEGTALSGDLAALPRDAGGHAAVLVIGFTKAASDITRAWLEGCRSAAAARPGEAGVSCYDVRMVEAVPHLFRGSMEHGMRSGLPVDLQRTTLLVYSENDAWRERLGASDPKTAYVIGCDREGRVRGTATGQYVETELKKVLETIAPIPLNRR